FYDSNPSWSPDGKQVLYNRRINAYEKIFMVDTADPSRKIQLTFGDSSDLQPSFSRDARTVYFTSDSAGGIFNLQSLSLDTGEIRRYTDIVGGVFTPLELPGEGGKPTLAYTSYGRGSFRLFRMTPGEPEAIIRPVGPGRGRRRRDGAEQRPDHALRHAGRSPLVLRLPVGRLLFEFQRRLSEPEAPLELRPLRHGLQRFLHRPVAQLGRHPAPAA